MSEGQQRLPPGQHGLPPELVARNQRERLIAAIAEACAEASFAEVSVADVVARAGVSTATFYKRFDSKLDCLLAAHGELFGRLLEEVDAGCAAAGGGGEAAVRAGIETCLELLAADPPSARLLTVEILAGGPAGAARYAEAIGALAERLRTAGVASRGADAGDVEWAAAAALAALVGRRVMAGQAASLPELGDELTAIATAPRG